MNSNNLTMQIDDNNIAWVTLDIADNDMNALSPALVDDLNQLCDQLQANRDIIGAILISGKPKVFVAGADINAVQALAEAEQGEAMVAVGQQCFARIEQLPIPVVAAVNGAALGGGYELVLSCDAIVASDNPETKVGLPEVMLGVLPGAGGCQRLPRRIGLIKSLDLLLTGKQVAAKKAKRLGMVDEVVPANALTTAAVAAVKKLAKDRDYFKKLRKSSLQEKLLESNPLGRGLIFKQARAKVAKQTHGNYPAPNYILECVETGLNQSLEAGFAMERKRFGQLCITPECKALVSLFFAGNDLKKEKLVAVEAGAPIQTLGVIGGGLMGGGIAGVSANQAKSQVRIKDINDEGLRNALKHLHAGWQRRVKRRSMTQAEMGARANQVTTTTDYSGFEKTELIIEAVFEKLAVKQQLLAEVEALPDAEQRIFASNTSSLRIRDIAAKAKYPQNVIGMHYFSPVEKMPLLEVIRHEGTSDEVTARCVEYGRRQGKTVIVVKDGAGFYINRMLGPYANEAAFLLAEGVAVDRIDKAMVKWGLPVGPFKLLDEVGVDVGSKVGPNLEAEFGERMAGNAMTEKLLADNRLGKKNARGFYDYNSKKGGVDESVYTLLGITANNSMDEKTIVERCSLMMLNEAALCLEDQTIRCARDGDLGAVYGIGYPPFLGGPFRTMDSMGIAKVVERLQHYQGTQGARFTPAQSLVEMASAGKNFYAEDNE